MTTRRLMFHFPKSEADQPIVYHLVKDHDLVVNIYRAKVTPDESGYMVLDVSGSEEDIRRGIAFVRSLRIEVSDSQLGLTWEEARCTSCGVCIPHCPTKALHFAMPERRTVGFNADLCIDCLSCIENCPFRACSSIFAEVVETRI